MVWANEILGPATDQTETFRGEIIKRIYKITCRGGTGNGGQTIPKQKLTFPCLGRYLFYGLICVDTLTGLELTECIK